MRAKITIELSPPEECTEKEFQEWIRFQLGTTNSMSLRNPLIDYDLDFKDGLREGNYQLSYEIK